MIDSTPATHRRRHQAPRRPFALLAALLLTTTAATFLPACSTGKPKPTVDSNPAAVLANDKAPVGQRARAVTELWNRAKAGQDDLDSTREALKSLAWSRRTPETIRTAAIDALFDDDDQTRLDDNANMLRLMLPTEPSWSIVGHISRLAAEKNLDTMRGSLVQSLARPTELPPVRERPEYLALVALTPQNSAVEDTIFDVFVGAWTRQAPTGTTPSAFEIEKQSKERTAAWAVLAQLDTDGARRRELLQRSAAAESNDPSVRLLRRAASELGIVPVTASELDWLQSLSPTGTGAEWWRQTTAAVANLHAQAREGLRLRHLEPIRWAAQHEPSWLNESRETLYETVNNALTGRPFYERDDIRRDDVPRPRPPSYRDQLLWGDLLAIRVIDRALSDPQLVVNLIAHAMRDMADKSTELGGVIDARPDGSFTIRMFDPRPNERYGDERFVAPQDMFDASGTSLAHYHFHAQRERNSRYAGPGPGDWEYAQQHQRNNLVFTLIRPGVLNADYYTAAPAGPGARTQRINIDLGETPQDASQTRNR